MESWHAGALLSADSAGVDGSVLEYLVGLGLAPWYLPPSAPKQALSYCTMDCLNLPVAPDIFTKKYGKTCTEVTCEKNYL